MNGGNAGAAAATANDADEYDLDALDIDRDFNVWESFRNSLVSTCSDMCAGQSAANYVDDRAYNPAVADGNNSLVDEEFVKATGRSQKQPQSPQPQDRAQSTELTKDERDYIRKWAVRVRKDEVYSQYYRPVPREQREMQELAAFLGVPEKPKDNGKKTKPKTPAAKFRKTINPLANNTKQKSGPIDAVNSASSALFYPEDDEPKSILLKRGPVLLRGETSEDDEERELILVTRGFIVAAVVSPEQETEDFQAGGQEETGTQDKAKSEEDTPPPPAKTPNVKKNLMGAMGKVATPILNTPRHLTALPGHIQNLPLTLQKKVIRRNFEFCDALADVTSVEDFALTDSGGAARETGHGVRLVDRSFSVTVGGGGGGEHQPQTRQKRLVFASGKAEQKAAWIEALEIAVVHARILSGQGGNDHELQPGWEHEILRTSLYSAAVLNDKAMMEMGLSLPRFKSRINELDSHGFTALHYATMRNNLNAMEMLLKAGANANAMNADQRIPMFFAEQYKFQTAATLLEKYGSKKATALDEASELFGQATKAVKKSMFVGAGTASTDRTSGANARGKAVRDTETKAKGVAGAMSDAMSALRERGERLQSLDEKTKALNDDAAEYGSLAKQLKEKAKKDAARFPF